MQNIIKKNFRDAASLIVLSKRGSELVSRSRDRCVNYDVLLQTRTKGASFANSVVFPGGVTEDCDASNQWIHLLQSFGYTPQDFNKFHKTGTHVTPIFQNNPVQRHVALRITAIRETFEELGLLICSKDHKNNKNNLWADYISVDECRVWQNRVSKDPTQLFNLCKEYNCYPDIWSLHYWSNWLTPVRYPKRFDTAFFITALKDKPTVESNSEVFKVEWSDPNEVLEGSRKKQVELYPPQFCELTRLSHLTDIEELIKFACIRSPYSDELFYPVHVRAKDGNIYLMPGDDLYPSAVNYVNDKTITTDKTITELRDSSNTLHRFEVTNSEEPENFFIIRNHKPKNHINVGDQIIRIFVTL